MLLEWNKVAMPKVWSRYFFCAGNVFQAYDFGRKGNLLHYGSINPFEYDITKITAPVLYFLNVT